MNYNYTAIPLMNQNSLNPPLDFHTTSPPLELLHTWRTLFTLRYSPIMLVQNHIRRFASLPSFCDPNYRRRVHRHPSF